MNSKIQPTAELQNGIQTKRKLDTDSNVIWFALPVIGFWPISFSYFENREVAFLSYPVFPRVVAM